VDINTDGRIIGFREKSDARQPGLISAGAYLLGPAALDAIGSDGVVSIENDIFPRLVGCGLFGIVGEGPFIDIGTPDDLARAGRLLVGTTVQLEARVDSGWRRDRLVSHLNGSLAVQRDTLASCMDQVLTAAQMIAVAFATDHKLLLCGNGGSAADSQHMATEFTSRLSKEVERPGLPAIALTTDTSFLTAFSNDVGFEGVFKRQVSALGRPGDVLVAISTSGNSPNVVQAVRAARQLGIETIGLVGEGGILAGEVDCAVVIPSRDTQYIQESLLPVEHAICDLVEQALFRHVQRQPVGAAAR
jgi:D-sedoheptulose 7-phosphate isomerase